MAQAQWISLLATAGILAVRPIAAVAQVPFDSVSLQNHRGCQLKCIDYRVTLTHAGAVRIDRSDTVSIQMTLSALEMEKLLDQFSQAGIDSLPDQIPTKNSDCWVFTDHSPTITVDWFVGATRRSVRDSHFCALNPEVFGIDQARRAARLRSFEAALDRAIGIDRWLR